MFDYLKAELLRFRSWAIAYFVLHLAVLGFFCRVMDLAQQPKVIYQGFGGVYLVSGLLLGAYQMASYRRPNTWLNLLHRPVDPRRIAGALASAAALLLLGGVLLPIVLCAAWQDTMTARVVDARHYELAASGGLLALCGYLSGAFAVLVNRRYAVAPIALLFGLGYSAATGAGALVFQSMTAGVLAAMVFVAFKPDRSAPPRGLRTAVIALPLQMSLWLLMIVLGLGFEIAWLLQGTHPNNLEIPIPGSAREADQSEARDLMIAGLKPVRRPDAALWREQAAISDLYTLDPNLAELPVRGQLTNPAPLEFEDATRRVRWVFAHDDMRFHGYSLASQRDAGVLAAAGGQRFTRPLLPMKDRLFAARDGLFQYDEDTGRILRRVSVPADEHVIGLGDVADRLGVVTNRALYLFDRRDLRDSAAPLAVRQRIGSPGRAGNLTRIDAMELLDGMLVSFTYTRGPFDGHGTAFQDIVRVDESGRSQPIAHRPLASGYPALYVFSRWYASPVLHGLAIRATRLFADDALESDRAPRPTPRSIQALALALCIASLLAAAWRTRRLALAPIGRIAWIVACGVVGMPALLALWLLYEPVEHDVRISAVPATA